MGSFSDVVGSFQALQKPLGVFLVSNFWICKLLEGGWGFRYLGWVFVLDVTRPLKHGNWREVGG